MQLAFAGDRLRPRWAPPVRLASALAVQTYVRCAYRIRGWGDLPSYGEPALVVANHQIDVDLLAVLSAMALHGGWRSPLFAATAKLLYEPGFFAIRIPWLSPVCRRANLGPLFAAMGMLPIENQIRTRSLARWAFAVQRRQGVRALEEIFEPRVLERWNLHGVRTCDLFGPKYFAAAQRPVKLSDLRPEYRREQFEITAREIQQDLERMEARLRSGATLFVTPEGEYSRDGGMRGFRGIWERLAPLAKTVSLVAISYDPFAGRRLSQLYRVVPLDRRERVVRELKAARPVTMSALLCKWLERAPQNFTPRHAADGVDAVHRSLPAGLFVDPQFERAPGQRVGRALENMARLGILRREGTRYRRGERRRHPQFPNVRDIVAAQARFLDETVAAAPKPAIFEDIVSARRVRV